MKNWKKEEQQSTDPTTLDEALNYYIDEEISSFEVILEDDTLTAYEKLDAVLSAYSQYAHKMVPLRSNKAFHTEKHYALTEKLIARLHSKVGKLLMQGLSENVFEMGDVDISAGNAPAPTQFFITFNEETGLHGQLKLNRNISDY